MAVVGDIAEEAKSYISRTWLALERSTGYGDPLIQRHRDNVVYKLFGDISMTEVEEEALNPLVKEYAGKALALSLCIPGIEYWTEQPIQVSAGERESKGYANRAAELRELRKILLEETRGMWPDVSALLPIRKVSRSGAPQVASLDSGHVTPDPMTFEPPWAEPTDATVL